MASAVICTQVYPLICAIAFSYPHRFERALPTAATVFTSQQIR